MNASQAHPQENIPIFRSNLFSDDFDFGGEYNSNFTSNSLTGPSFSTSNNEFESQAHAMRDIDSIRKKPKFDIHHQQLSRGRQRAVYIDRPNPLYSGCTEAIE